MEHLSTAHRQRNTVAQIYTRHTAKSVNPLRIVGTFGACRLLNEYDINKFARLGIPPEALVGPSRVRASYVHFDQDHFEFEHHHRWEGAVPAYLFLVINRWGEAHDIVAWSLSLGRLATWLERAWALGEEMIYEPRLTDHGGLLVHRTPVGWLNAHQEGICLVRPQAAVHHLDCGGPLLAEDVAHGADLEQLLTRPAPRILVPSPAIKEVASS